MNTFHIYDVWFCLYKQRLHIRSYILVSVQILHLSLFVGWHYLGFLVSFIAPNAGRVWMVLKRLIKRNVWNKKLRFICWRQYESLHPSIFYTCLIQGLWGAWGLSQLSLGEMQGVHPGQVASPSQGHAETNNHAHSLMTLHFYTHQFLHFWPATYYRKSAKNANSLTLGLC